ncbi:hypothetical protein OZX67_09230 [Bifidobacterium sp. ESL0728]|uniref:hypothetical protein n=1 Tax=Bifidobacterium sp. ESL0728 TaxID=2983220 RepID=UPI0023FA2CFD|nr:hypothetical protein [Bifidobacterium sp. ESL0728]WEV58951.1 hypothetical protein OZX67_09230 [Bifidobacterium sp. ESL0728]
MADYTDGCYTDEQRKEIADLEYPKREYNVGERLYTQKDTGSKFVGYVAAVNHNSATGEDSYMVVDADPTAKGYKPSDVKHVTVLYQGSQNWQDYAEDAIDGGQILNVGRFAGPIVGPVWGAADDIGDLLNVPRRDVPSQQLLSSSNTLKGALAEYKNAKVDVYGHSLGSMDGQYALASLSPEESNRIDGAWLYEGPNMYSFLTADQRRVADQFSARGIVHNYIDRKDLVPIGYGNNAHIGNLIVVDSNWAPGEMNDELESKNPAVFLVGVGKYAWSWFLKQHGWGGYQFDKDGRLKVVGGDKALDEASELADKELGAVDDERKALEKNNGGKLTGAETIYLDEQEAGAIVNGIHSLTQNELQEMQGWCNGACAKADEEWQGTLHDATVVGQNLSAGEVMDALAAGSATKERIVSNPQAQYQAELNGFVGQVSVFDDLAGKINQAAQTLVSTDQQLALQLRAIGR